MFYELMALHILNWPFWICKALDEWFSVVISPRFVLSGSTAINTFLFSG